MHPRSVLTPALVLGVLAGTAVAQNTGPDVIVADITGPQLWSSSNGISGYSIGSEACNIGTVQALWDDETGDGTPANRHPVIAQNIFRYMNGRFEQLGQSWLKHSFFALQNNGICGLPCQPSNVGGSALGVGCSDPYDTGLNGSQSGLGPKFEVNPSTGAYPWPYTGRGLTGNAAYKRIQVPQTDVDPALNPGALYYGEVQYVTPDDAAAGNNLNNASWRRINVGAGTRAGFALSFTGSTQRQQPAIFAWKVADPGVELVSVDVPGDGRFWVGYRVTGNDVDGYRYEYAIQNLTSDRAASAFTVPGGSTVLTAAPAFADVDYHSGEPYDNTDWTATISADSTTWSNGTTFATNPNANALRWGTLYNFAFTSPFAPAPATATINLFKPGATGSMAVTVLAPAFVATGCSAADLAEAFGTLDINDVLAFASAFNTMDTAADFFADGMFDINDVLTFATGFNAGCP